MNTRHFLKIMLICAVASMAQPGVNALFVGDSATVLESRSNATSGAGRYAIKATATSVSGGVGLFGKGSGAGLQGVASTAGFGSRQGIYGRGDSGTYNYGGYFDAYRGSETYGIAAMSWSSGGVGYGVYARASSGSGSGYGIIAQGSGNAGTNYGIHATGTQYAGYFNGNVLVAGTFSNPSDLMFKKNVRPLEDGIAKIMALQPKTYEMTVGKFDNINFDEGIKYGLIAQEVEQVLPDLVSSHIAPALPQEPGGSDKIGKDVHFKSVDYLALIPILVKSVQEQQREIAALKQTIQRLEGR